MIKWMIGHNGITTNDLGHVCPHAVIALKKYAYLILWFSFTKTICVNNTEGRRFSMLLSFFFYWIHCEQVCSCAAMISEIIMKGKNTLPLQIFVLDFCQRLKSLESDTTPEFNCVLIAKCLRMIFTSVHPSDYPNGSPLRFSLFSTAHRLLRF